MRRDLPTYEELLKIFSSEKLKPIGRIIIIVCLGGLFVFSVIVILYFTQYGIGPSKSNSELLNIMNRYFIPVIFLLLILGMAEGKIFTRLVKARKITSKDISNPDSRSVLNLIKIFSVMKLTRVESGLFLIAFWLLISAQQGYFDSYLHYWLTIPIVMIIYSIAKVFPTSKRVARLVQEKIYPLIEE